MDKLIKMVLDNNPISQRKLVALLHVAVEPSWDQNEETRLSNLRESLQAEEEIQSLAFGKSLLQVSKEILGVA